MLEIDAGTINIACTMISWLCTFLIGGMWQRNVNKFIGIQYMFIGFLIHSIGVTSLLLFAADTSVIMRDILPNGMVIAGALFFLIGALKFLHIKVYVMPLYIYILVYAVISIYVYLQSVDLIIYRTFVSVMLIPLYSWIVFGVLTLNRHELGRRGLGVAGVSVLIVLVNIIRSLSGISYILLNSTFHEAFMDPFCMILNMILRVLLTFSVVMMMLNDLILEVKHAGEDKELILEEMKKLAVTDPLTKIFNRRKIEELLANEIERNSRYNTTFSVILADIDFFKHVNDIYGHGVGDNVLVKVVEVMKQHIRKLDYIGRWGGEEFLILLPDSQLEEAMISAENVRKSISETDYHMVGCHERVTISLGVMEYDNRMDSAKLLNYVDTMLYQAKNSGRDKVIGG